MSGPGANYGEVWATLQDGIEATRQERQPIQESVDAITNAVGAAATSHEAALTISQRANDVNSRGEEAAGFLRDAYTRISDTATVLDTAKSRLTTAKSILGKIQGQETISEGGINGVVEHIETMREHAKAGAGQAEEAASHYRQTTEDITSSSIPEAHQLLPTAVQHHQDLQALAGELPGNLAEDALALQDRLIKIEQSRDTLEKGADRDIELLRQHAVTLERINEQLSEITDRTIGRTNQGDELRDMATELASDILKLKARCSAFGIQLSEQANVSGQVIDLATAVQQRFR